MVLVFPVFKHIGVKARTEIPVQTVKKADQTTHLPAAQSESCLPVFWPQFSDAMQCKSKLESNMDSW